MDKKQQSIISRFFLPLWVAATYLFLYVPLVILTVFSFNNASFPYRWVGFSWRWYQELAVSNEIWQAALNSFFVASSSVFLSLTLALFFVLWTADQKRDWLLKLFLPNLVVPEIVIAVGMLSLFVFCNIPLGLPSLIVGHTLLGLGYAIPIIHARFTALNISTIEASLDLGANYQQTFFTIVIPLLRPALLSAGLLTFILSLDDFLIAFFCAGASAQTLSLYIFSMIRSGVSPVINALATLMIMVSSALVILFCSVKVKEDIW